MRIQKKLQSKKHLKGALRNCTVSFYGTGK